MDDTWLVFVSLNDDGRSGTIDFGRSQCPSWLNNNLRVLDAEGGEKAAFVCKNQIVEFNPPLVPGQRNQRTTLKTVDTVSCRAGRIQKAKKAQEVAA